nr:hypothetical protein [Sphingopyxis sp. PET50]
MALEGEDDRGNGADQHPGARERGRERKPAPPGEVLDDQLGENDRTGGKSEQAEQDISQIPGPDRTAREAEQCGTQRPARDAGQGYGARAVTIDERAQKDVGERMDDARNGERKGDVAAAPAISVAERLHHRADDVEMDPDDRDRDRRGEQYAETAKRSGLERRHHRLVIILRRTCRSGGRHRCAACRANSR